MDASESGLLHFLERFGELDFTSAVAGYRNIHSVMREKPFILNKAKLGEYIIEVIHCTEDLGICFNTQNFTL